MGCQYLIDASAHIFWTSALTGTAGVVRSTHRGLISPFRSAEPRNAIYDLRYQVRMIEDAAIVLKTTAFITCSLPVQNRGCRRFGIACLLDRVRSQTLPRICSPIVRQTSF